ncbi:hypothetical protein Ahy_B05g078282 [Arachis hypogaea]|uniref:Uncharacterized protein n=1 Tax=Arachis hypogaea TaxID=3818 RepID=A0A444Z6R1_ARAHY|nr:hypothetical protein Ahy_B05g078282 [Arachis hypogaea]
MEAGTKSSFSHKSKLDNICNNVCEIFNAKIKNARAKPIISLLEKVRIFVMRIIAKNKVKLNNHIGVLIPSEKSLRIIIKPIWIGDNGYKNFEVHRHPTNHVVELEKRYSLCACMCCTLSS